MDDMKDEVLNSSTTRSGFKGMRSVMVWMVSLLCILLTAGKANAALIAEWQFNNYTGGAVSQAAEYGTQAASATASAGTKYTFSQTTGTTLNEFASSSPNNALRMVTTGGNPGDALLTLQLSGVGLSGFVLTYASQDSANISQTWAWSINGTVFNAVASTVVSTTWNSYTLDFSGVTALNNATRSTSGILLQQVIMGSL